MRARLMLWIAVPLILLVPACLASLFSIQNLPTTFLILALLETNQAELSALQVPVLFSGLGTLILVTLYVWFVKTRVPSSFRLGPVGRGVIISSLLIPISYDILAQGHVVGLAGIKQRCLTTFPCSTLYGAYEAFDIRSRVQNRKELVEDLALKQEQAFQDEPNRQVHMLVIGESATKSCFGLYGYDRQTTPLLERTAGLMTFRDVSCTAPCTLLAVPALLTAATPGKLLEATRQASILTAYKKAGFRVYWLSAQKKHGTYDTLTSIFSAESDEDIFLSGRFDDNGRGAYQGAWDASLLPLVRGIMQRKEPKVLFVLHTIGSHGPYPTRYPPELARFPAEPQTVMDTLFRISLGGASTPEELELAQNSYDNTICATDFLLANLINELKNAQASSWLCYVSDHGENTSTARFGKFLHGMITRQVVEVPMLMWVSPLYEQAHAGKVAGLKAHLNTPFSASCTFHTLLDMGGLSCPDFKKERSSASLQFSPGPRIVCDANGNLMDYDEKFPVRQDAANVPPPQSAEKIQQIAAGVQRP
ncbi:phosphoethanolamine transferase [Prosthecobacter sp.]|uniref:phosphoethanolamine transferase n=1 Tax=Prosthecobacter sp. TaxID=1965333 RepID=UPI002489C5F7|nr:phosphoethanolamine transferase [Prosthecobacter sp.]MDI1312835.1 phosphoethanolamine transferase [Prosthecobacter sp.]